MNIGHLSLEEAAKVVPWIQQTMRRLGPKNYEDFIEQLYEDLLVSFQDLERHAATYETQDEDQITGAICLSLRQLGYTAEHDVSQSGHVDLWVKTEKYRWIGEAKIFRAMDNMREGMRQLVTRYSNAVEESRSALLAYIKAGVTTEKMAKWRDELSTCGEHQGLAVEKCPRRDPVAFVSRHKHANHGVECEVWHIGISLQHDPKDKSGRARGRIGGCDTTLLGRPLT
jgi:hypothetical protein